MLLLRFARSRAALPVFVFLWRLGLGPLLGRRLCLITTATEEGHVERRALPYVFSAGDMFVPVVGDRRWADAAARKPQVTVQAHPGPLATRARPVTDDERRGLLAAFPTTAPSLLPISDAEWWVLRPTGDPAPPAVLPDLNWVWVVVAVAAVIMRRAMRRRG